MNILYFFPEKDTVMFEWQRIHIFDELSRHGINFMSFNPLRYNSWEEANEALIKNAKAGHYDLFLTDTCSPHMLFAETLKEIKALGLPIVSFRPDNLVIPFNDKEIAPLFDLVWLTARETKYLYDRWNVKTIVAPYAANPYIFQYKASPLKRRVCFIGTPYGSRARMMNTLTQGGVDLSVFYSPRKNNQQIGKSVNPKMSIYNRGTYRKLKEGLFFKEGRKLLYAEALYRLFNKEMELDKNVYYHENPSVSVVEQCDVYSQYCMSLASTSTGFTDILRNPLPIINLRNFEIPMSGGIELCRFNSELAEYFEAEKEIVFYHSKDELIEKADYYLHKAKDEEILRIKMAARKRAELEHTWFRRFSVVFDNLGLDY